MKKREIINSGGHDIQQITRLLKLLPYFSHVPEQELETYATQAVVFKLDCGDTLIEEGEKDQKVYILLDGRLRATTMNLRKGEAVIGEISKGEIVGETAALLQKPRGATVRAMRESMLMEIHINDLVKFSQKTEEAIKHFARNILQRNQPNFAHNQKTNSLLVFPLSKEIDMRSFISSLHAEILRYVEVRELFEEDAHPSVDLTDHVQLASYFSGLETQSEQVVFVSRGEWTPWTAASAARADKILLVGKANQNPSISPVEKKLWDTLNTSNQAQVDLALLHSSRSDQPNGTKNWYNGRTLNRHYHVAENEVEHFQKLARFLTGNAIGFALSGGGFKASMQAGVLHAMREAGIPLDILGGSSGGALAGAFFATEPKLEDISNSISVYLDKFKNAGKLTLPMVSLFTGKHLTNGFKHFFQETDIEDLWNAFFCMSLNLVNGEIKAHQRGKLWEAVRASASVMALFPPVLGENECLVDGGFVNPCPTDVLNQMGVGKVVVISAFESGGITPDAYFPPETGGWNILWKKLNPFSRGKFVPSLGTNVVQSMMFASEHLLQDIYASSNIDLYIAPDLRKYSSQDATAVKALYQLGYDYAKERVDEWKETIMP